MLPIMLNGSKIEARLVHRNQSPCLVATFRASAPPLLWQFDLEKNQSFTLGLQGVEGAWDFGVTLPRGEFQPVARFVSREDAEQAREIVRRALMKRPIEIKAWLKAVVSLAALAVVLFIALLLTGQGRSVPRMATSVSTQVEESSGTGEPKYGVPQSADDVLKPPR